MKSQLAWRRRTLGHQLSAALPRLVEMWFNSHKQSEDPRYRPNLEEALILVSLSGNVMIAKSLRASAEKSLILYSTNTWIAYMIAEHFYDGEHYVWCTPYFDPRQNGRDAAVPPTSSPLEMYRMLFEEVARGEQHSSKIAENKVGILRGASAKQRSKIISTDQQKQIGAIIKRAQVSDFRPLVYVIPFALVAKRLREPPPEDKAHPLSAEFVIDRLPRSCFDVIEFGGRL